MKYRNRITLLATAAALLALASTRAHAAAFTVNNLDDRGPGSLRQAILNANSTMQDDTISFVSGLTGTIELTGGQMDVTGNVNILGPGASSLLTIDAGGRSRIFEIAAGVTIEIRGLTLTKGKADNGGAILSSGNLTVTGCTLSDNAADDDGGAVFTDGNLTVQSSILTANEALGGGAIQVQYDLPELQVRISTCFVTGNRARFVGGGIFVPSGVATVTTSSFLGNEAGVAAAALYNHVAMTMSNCTFADNRVDAGDIVGDSIGGGAMWHAGAGVLTATNCSFSGNASDTQGGAILNTGDSLTLTNCALSGNNAPVGGAIASYRDLVMDRSTLSGNHARHGGAVFQGGGTARLTHSTLSDNVAGGDGFGGGAILNDAVMTISLCTLSGNWTNRAGGAILNDGSLTLLSTTLSGNAADRGGGLHSQDSLTAIQCAVKVNSARTGGGIHSRSALTLRDCTVSANFADQSGGGVLKELGTATLTGCTIFANFAATTGGGVHNEVGELTLSRSTVAGNSAVNPAGLGAGGGIFNRSAVTVLSSTVNGNIAREGAGLFNAGGPAIDDGGPPPVPASLIIKNSTVSGNTAGSVGGGLLNQGVVFMAWCTFFGNRAEEGGGIRNLLGGSVRVGNTILANSGAGGNSVNDPGGTVTSLGHNLDDNGTGGFLGPGDQVGTPGAPIDPMLGPLQNNSGRTWTHALAPGSPAIDAGETFVEPEETDQRDFARIADGNLDGTAVIDIGAFELSFFRPHDLGGLPRDGFLTYSTIEEQETSLPAGTGSFPLTIHYSADVAPQTFAAKINGQDISHLFNPATPLGFETVLIPLREGENRLIVRVKGVRDGRPAQDVDSLGFRVGEPPYGPRR